MMTFKRSGYRQYGANPLVVACGAMLAFLAVGPDRTAMAEPAPNEVATIHRLSPAQYRSIIAEVFGPTITIAGRFEPDIRADGLLAVGAGQISITATGLEQFDSMARSIAAQVVDEEHRGTLMPCKPEVETAADHACASQFLSEVGQLLYRRPLTQQEIQTRVAAAAMATKTSGNFYSGIAFSLAGMLESPPFLFRKLEAKPDPAHPGKNRLDNYSKASQLSFFLWNAMPDEALLAAARKGELDTKRGLAREVNRMLASPRLETGVRSFFADMLGFDRFSSLTKDTMLYPKFTTHVSDAAQEQTLRTIVDTVLTHNEDFRNIYTTRKTFLTPALAAIYRAPLTKSAPNGGPDNWWQPHEYSPGDPRAGILTHVSFVALHSHPGRSSPTLRGKALRETILCQKVPDPPGNVDFTVVQETENPIFKTARERLIAHRTNPVCAGCHRITDPMGLALETFDTTGGFRTTENGAPIDGSGDLDGAQFKDSVGLGQAVHDNPATSSCLVRRMYSYAVGRKPSTEESKWIGTDLEKRFATKGYRVPELMRLIALSEQASWITPPAETNESVKAENTIQTTIGKTP